MLLAMGSMTGTIKDTIDSLRSAGEKVGLIKLRCYRPFPYEEIWAALKGAKVLAVIDSNLSLGSEGAIGMDLKAKLYGMPDAPQVMSVIAGLAGRDINDTRVREIVSQAKKAASAGFAMQEPYWAGINQALVP